MANADHIAEALFTLEEELTSFEVLLDAFDAINPDNTPSWLAVMSDRFKHLNEAANQLGGVMRRDVLPLQRDFQSLTRSGGGMGAMAPMVTKVPDGKSINSRT